MSKILPLLILGTALYGAGSLPSTTTLQGSVNPSTLSQAVTLTVTVTPAAATGKVTFFDGVSQLGVATLSGGKATLVMTLLRSGIRTLKAFYNGDVSYKASASASLSQTVLALAQKGFQSAVVVGGVSFPRAIAIADFNGDGIADVAVDDYDLNMMSVLLGKGDGSFQPAVSYGTGTAPTNLVVADFNGDGHPDIAVSNGGTPSNSVSVFLNNGSGAFSAAVTYAIGDPNTLVNPNIIVTADFNGDGIADLATSNFSDNTISVLLGKGDGTFAFPVKFAAGSNPGAMAAADLNGDGIADLVLLNGAKAVNVLLGNGNGTFKTLDPYVTSSVPGALTIGDFNGDGRLDLAVTNAGGTDTIAVMLGNGDGTFQPVVSYSTPSHVQSVATGDFDGDGIADLVVADSASNNVNVLLGMGDGTFQQPVTYGPIAQPIFVTVGDFNGDGHSDLAVANFGPGQGFSVLLGVAAPPSPVITKVANAEGESLTIASNTWVEIKGARLGPAAARIWQDADFVNKQLPTSLDGVKVTMNGESVFVYYISSTQVNVLTPPDLLPGPVQVLVSYNGAISPIFTSHALALSPSFFVFGGGPYVAAVHLDGTYIGPASLYPGATTPVKPGETIMIYANGFGPTSVNTVSGSLSQSGTLAPLPVVKIGGVPANVSYAGLIPVGEFQFNVDIPASLPDGDATIIATYNGSSTQAGTLITVQH